MNNNFDLEKQMFNSSSIANYMGCPKLFELGTIRRLESKEVNVAMNFGSVMHEALLVWYKEGNVEEGLKKFDQLPEVITDDHRTRGWGQSIFKLYVERYKTEVGKTLHLEVMFRVEIKDRIYSGTMDRIEDWNGHIYVDDHKTTKQLGLSFFEAFRPSPQIDGYCFATREIVGKCHGAVINGISVAKNPKERFQRFPSSRTDREMDQWKEIFTDATDGMMRCVEKKHFPRHTSHGHKWFRKCPVWNLCVYGEDEAYIAQNYKLREDEDGAVAEKSGSGK